MLPEPKDHFDSIYKYIKTTTYIVLLYVMLVTFIPIPKENQRFVDIALAFLLGWASNSSQFLTGASASPNKKPTPPSEGGDNITDGDVVTVNKE